MRRYESLRGRREFTLTVKKGNIASAGSLTVHALTRRSTTPETKVGIVVTKKVGKAVVRNRVRRRCKAILDEVLAGSMNRRYVIHCKPSAAAIPFAELKRQLGGAV